MIKKIVSLKRPFHQIRETYEESEKQNLSS